MFREFKELVEAETFVDMDRLRDLSRHGIPASLRGDIWKYLLNVASPDKCTLISFIFFFKTFYSRGSHKIKKIEEKLRRCQQKSYL